MELVAKPRKCRFVGCWYRRKYFRSAFGERAQERKLGFAFEGYVQHEKRQAREPMRRGVLGRKRQNPGPVCQSQLRQLRLICR